MFMKDLARSLMKFENKKKLMWGGNIKTPVCLDWDLVNGARNFVVVARYH